jgi:glyoxylase-like metal-dependent hydrolase (beta-lactamase superfamily II)
MEALTHYGLTLEKIWITHGHLDHAGAAATLKEQTGVPIEGPHPDDAFWIDQIDASGAKWGMPEARGFTPDRWLHDGDKVTLGETEFEVYHCPGHTPGHVIFFHREARFAQVGDVLFQGSIGRTDLPFADHPTLERTLATLVRTLPPETTVYPGHMGVTTLGRELATNPFLVELHPDRPVPQPAPVRGAGGS